MDNLLHMRSTMNLNMCDREQNVIRIMVKLALVTKENLVDNLVMTLTPMECPHEWCNSALPVMNFHYQS